MEDLLALIPEYGGLGLFLFALASATILPISSEAAFVAAMGLGMEPMEALAWSSAGNCVGVGLNYVVGYIFSGPVLRKLQGSRWGRKSLGWTEQYGTYCLLLSWTPFFGDPITYAAGAVRFHPVIFILITFPLRIARYAVFLVFFL